MLVIYGLPLLSRFFVDEATSIAFPATSSYSYIYLAVGLLPWLSGAAFCCRGLAAIIISRRLKQERKKGKIREVLDRGVNVSPTSSILAEGVAPELDEVERNAPDEEEAKVTQAPKEQLVGSEQPLRGARARRRGIAEWRKRAKVNRIITIFERTILAVALLLTILSISVAAGGLLGDPACVGDGCFAECNPQGPGGSGCLLPFPSMHYLQRDQSKPSGYRISISAASLPLVRFRLSSLSSHFGVDALNERYDGESCP